jgi:lysophospholipase
MLRLLILLGLAASSPFVISAPTSGQEGHVERQALTPYAPVTVPCGGGRLVRPANGIGAKERNYVQGRKQKADGCLASWLKTRGKFDTSSQPIVGLTSSGGGYRALLETAGVVQALDERDSSSSVGGIFQGRK